MPCHFAAARATKTNNRLMFWASFSPICLACSIVLRAEQLRPSPIAMKNGKRLCGLTKTTCASVGGPGCAFAQSHKPSTLPRLVTSFKGPPTDSHMRQNHVVGGGRHSAIAIAPARENREKVWKKKSKSINSQYVIHRYCRLRRASSKDERQVRVWVGGCAIILACR
ncbi:hypothetical protein BDV97DRAFT_347267 [Delphinella strobiligena]|nr:hypothetical protein BDV97DRAFT_347267 [Delphinella strobiligena]